MLPKGLDGMADSLFPHHAQSDLGVHCLPRSLSVQKFRIVMVLAGNISYFFIEHKTKHFMIGWKFLLKWFNCASLLSVDFSVSLFIPSQTVFVGDILFSRCSSICMSVLPSMTLWFFLNILKRQWWKFIKLCRILFNKLQGAELSHFLDTLLLDNGFISAQIVHVRGNQLGPELTLNSSDTLHTQYRHIQQYDD